MGMALRALEGGRAAASGMRRKESCASRKKYLKPVPGKNTIINMRRSFLFCGCLLLITSVPAFSQRTTQNSTAGTIADVRSEWVKNFIAKSITDLVALYSDDAALLLPSGERIVGKDKITAYFKQIFDSASGLRIKLDSDKTDSSGELGFDSGRYEETITQAGGGTVMSGIVASGIVVSGGGSQSEHRGSYLSVLRRQTERWLIVQQATTETAQTSGR
ncbi:MAG: Ketosteroid isomerase [Candidatus Sulfotelmatobacter sp.]|nr:Ketosteroid isomerase [Candidatus Sulfotelmatobacter sp.]